MKKSGLWLRKLLSTALICSMVMGLAGCDEEDLEDDWNEEVDQEVQDQMSGGTRSGNASAMEMTVNKDSGDMQITRPKWDNKAMGEAGTWTVFVYLCGSDLESGDGAGVADITEMCEATESDDVRFVVQTGGASSWSNNEIDAGKAQRFIVEGGNITNVYDGKDSSMGDSDTLASFVSWGVQEYPADNMGLIMWDHGSGSINGVCFDENHDNDSLSLREVDSALMTAQQYMTEKWEFIGFDACLMGSVEAANILANYSNYMYGSEEVEPGAGWNYLEIGNYLAKNPGASGADLGKVVCDSFYDGCVAAGDYDCCTLAVIDLSKIDALMTAFNSFAKDIYETGENADKLSTMMRSISNSETFGSNNDSEGYTNMVDLSGLANACKSYSSNADAVKNAVKDAIVYKIHGSDHPNACGLSIYFPISVEGSTELKTFSDICISPFYMSFIDRRDYSASYYSDDSNNQTAETQSDYYQDEESGISYFVQDGENYCYEESSGTYYYYNSDTEEWEEVEADGLDAQQYEYCSSNDANCGYSDDDYYDDDGNWSWNCDYDYDQSSGTYRSRPTQTNRYDYADSYNESGDSKHIKFLKAPGIDDEGVFRFTLTKYSLDHTADVYAEVYMITEDDEALFLGDTYDVECDWENGTFKDMFDGYWLSLPDGQNLSTYIVDANDDFVIYTSPILLNGEETNLRFRQTLADGSIAIEGAWDGLAESGAASRNFRKIKDGDKIVPLYESFKLDDKMEEFTYEGEEYTVSGNFGIDYDLLYEGDFMYSFVIEDMYRDYLETDMVCLSVDADGVVWLYEEE